MAEFPSGRSAGEPGPPVLLPERPVQLHGSRVARALLQLAGWRVVFDGLPARQGVLIVYPHTSNWDFVVGVLAKWCVGIPVTFWGKDSLFRLPLFGRWLRWLGGLPVDRDAAHGLVGQMVQALEAARGHDRFLWLALSPEGTRRHSDSWRSGFYHVSLRAKVPLGLVGLDYAGRVVTVAPFMRLGGDAAADMAGIGKGLGNPIGKWPKMAAPIRLRT